MPKRILVVDDDRAVLQSCENILSYEGHEVVTAVNGVAGLELSLPDDSGVNAGRGNKNMVCGKCARRCLEEDCPLF